MKTLLITAMCLFCLTAQAQTSSNPRSTLKVGFGTAFLGTGDYFGKHRFVEYDRSIFPFMSIGLGGGWTSASQGDALGFSQSTKAYQGDLNLYLSPLHNNTNRLRFGVGTSYRHSDHQVTTAEFADPAFTQTISNDWGYGFVADYEVYVVKHIVLGARTAFQKYKNNDRVFFFGLNAGVRF